jgi:hypothetical protein
MQHLISIQLVFFPPKKALVGFMEVVAGVMVVLLLEVL